MATWFVSHNVVVCDGTAVGDERDLHLCVDVPATEYREQVAALVEASSSFSLRARRTRSTTRTTVSNTRTSGESSKPVSQPRADFRYQTNLGTAPDGRIARTALLH